MDFVDTNARLLNRLLEIGSVSSSSVSSKAAKVLFQKLEQIGLVQQKRKGAGNQYLLLDSNKLESFITNHYPSGLSHRNIVGMPRRVKGIFSSKNSKALNKLDFDIVTMRGNQALSYQGKQYDLIDLTDTNTYLSLKLVSDSKIQISDPVKTIFTVENPTSFCELDSMIGNKWDIAIYTVGKMSNILLEQLEVWGKQGHHIVHFGDYDYVGLLEFCRVLKCCPNARFYISNSLTSDIFHQFGSNALLKKQVTQHKELQQVMTGASSSNGVNDIERIYRLIQDSAKGLEQESLYFL